MRFVQQLQEYVLQEGQELLPPAPEARCLQPVLACAAPHHPEGFWGPSRKSVSWYSHVVKHHLEFCLQCCI